MRTEGGRKVQQQRVFSRGRNLNFRGVNQPPDAGKHLQRAHFAYLHAHDACGLAHLPTRFESFVFTLHTYHTRNPNHRIIDHHHPEARRRRRDFFTNRKEHRHQQKKVRNYTTTERWSLFPCSFVGFAASGTVRDSRELSSSSIIAYTWSMREHDSQRKCRG